MNAEDRDYLDLIGARGDPDADKRWLIAHLKAEAQKNEVLFIEKKQKQMACDSYKREYQAAEARAEALEAECRQAKALLQYVLDCDMAEQDWDACRLQDFLTPPGPAQGREENRKPQTYSAAQMREAFLEGVSFGYSPSHFSYEAEGEAERRYPDAATAPEPPAKEEGRG